jgi:hypothetical protein
MTEASPAAAAQPIATPNFPGYEKPVTTLGQNPNVSPGNLALIARTRALTLEFIDLMHEAGGTVGVDGQPDRMNSRDLSLALTALEDAESRVIRHLTGGGPIRRRTPVAV